MTQSDAFQQNTGNLNYADKLTLWRKLELFRETVNGLPERVNGFLPGQPAGLVLPVAAKDFGLIANRAEYFATLDASGKHPLYCQARTSYPASAKFLPCNCGVLPHRVN